MRTVEVFQCELNRTIPLEYIGTSIYIGESFGVDSFTSGKEYVIVKDDTGALKVVDDSDEDYLWDLRYPRPWNGESGGGELFYVDDPMGVLCQYQRKYVPD